MADLRLEYEDVEGIFSIMPTLATEDASDLGAGYTLDEEEAERAPARSPRMAWAPS